MIKCPNCSAELEFDSKSQSVTCEYCRSTFNPKELDVSIKKSEEKVLNGTYEGKSYLCSQCGAELMNFDETAITFCSYCGSQAMIESKMIKRNNPEFIIPFKLTKEDCIKAYKRKVSKSLFAPNYLKSDIVLSKFRGIYIPYCIYKLSFKGNAVNKGSKYSHRSGDYVYYDDYNIHALVDAEYDGISYELISKFYDEYSHAIPHNFKEAEPFNVNYLAGFYADASDVDDSVYSDNAKKIVDYNSINYMVKRREFRKYGCSNPKVSFSVTDRRVGMFPLYFLALRDKENKNVNYAIVNGQTGKVAADMPVDFKKYILTSLLLAVPIFFLINSQLVIVPKMICIFSIVVSFISLIISFNQLDNIAIKEQHLNDEGYMNANKKNKIGKPNNIKFKDVYKQLLSIVLAGLVLFINFVDDIYYYGSTTIVLLLIIWSFYDLIKEHNLVVSTKLPQLEKRGGTKDE